MDSFKDSRRLLQLRSARDGDGTIVVEVEDCGPGIDPGGWPTSSMHSSRQNPTAWGWIGHLPDDRRAPSRQACGRAGAAERLNFSVVLPGVQARANSSGRRRGRLGPAGVFAANESTELVRTGIERLVALFGQEIDAAGACIALLAAAASVSITGFGVPAGARSPSHRLVSKSGTPASAMVGTSGSTRNACSSRRERNELLRLDLAERR